MGGSRESLEGLGEGKNVIKIGLNLKTALNNKIYKNLKSNQTKTSFKVYFNLFC